MLENPPANTPESPVVEANIEKQALLNVGNYSPEQLARAKELAVTIDYSDTKSILQYGFKEQKNLSSFSDILLTEVRSKDTGYVGEIMSDLLVNVKDMGVDGLGEESALAKIPILGRFVSKIRKFISRYEKLSVQIESISNELEKARMQLITDVTMLDGLFDKNLAYIGELDILILAGQMKLKVLQEEEVPKLQAKAEKSGDPMDAQILHDFTQMLDRFEKKLHDLKLTRMISIQSSPQIRLIQNNNQLLVEKIQSSILNTIPLWKSQIVIALGLFRQKKALALQTQVTKTTNEMLKKNAAMLKDSSLEIARESNRGIVEIDTLKKVNADLISTLEETLNIQREGKSKRAQAETELVQLEAELKEKLKVIAGQ